MGPAHEARPLSRSLVKRLKINNGGLINSMAGPEGHAKELLMRLEPCPGEPLNRICLCPHFTLRGLEMLTVAGGRSGE